MNVTAVRPSDSPKLWLDCVLGGALCPGHASSCGGRVTEPVSSAETPALTSQGRERDDAE